MILSVEPGELFANLAFKTSVCGVIIARLCHFLREVLFSGGIGIWLIMGVTIFLTVAHLLHQLRRRIAQVNRHVVIRTFTCISQRGFEGGVNCITFRRAGQINNRLSNRTFAFRWSHAGKAVPCGNCHLHGARIGIAHIFRGNCQAATSNIQRVTACTNDARIPIKRGIRCTAANRFM
ncbi:hypothetical protein SDC9_186214 [bioreactor metagenome]|uniref:Uncharacterized protein n=1 Tax=bioreactor metagenome TaxID=1076179 RepID=A0A645HKH3_9ZZZZ